MGPQTALVGGHHRRSSAAPRCWLEPGQLSDPNLSPGPRLTTAPRSVARWAPMLLCCAHGESPPPAQAQQCERISWPYHTLFFLGLL